MHMTARFLMLDALLTSSFAGISSPCTGSGNRAATDDPKLPSVNRKISQ
jgi:hypothetical protein